MLYNAPRQARLLAYTSLCRPILEYADSVWDLSLKKTINDIEMVQNRAVRFISRLKGRDSVSKARCELGLQTLQERRKNHRLTLLTGILQAEDTHSLLMTIVTMTTRSAARGELTSISTNSWRSHQSFLPRTIQEMRGHTSNN